MPPPLAVNAVNLSMYPVNLSNYVTSNYTNYLDTYAAPIFGGHFTVAVGDPFLVSSYAAKILWYITSGMGYAFSNNSLSASDIANLQNLVAPPGASGVFNSGSYSAAYAAWLLASPSEAESAISTMNKAALTPITKESIWGKVFSQAATLAIDAGIASAAALTGGASTVAQAAVNTVGLEAGGFTDAATNAITVNNTSTISQPAPVSATAPVVINDTYSAGNLLGLLLTNTFVQAEINNTLSSFNTSSFALWSNDSICTDSLCSNINVTNNLMSGSCGTPSGTAQVYTNALSTYTNSQSTAQLSLWDSVLTGSDITASNGYMILQNPSIPTFTPPTQVVNATGTVPMVTPGIAAANVTFSNPTGMLNVASYTVNNPSSASTPAGGSIDSVASGYLTCQSTPSLPYNACVNDPQATGGVIVGITTAPIANGTGATFQLGCACIPSYLEGPVSGTSLGGVFVGATNTNLSGQCN